MVIGFLIALPLSEAHREQVIEDTLRGSQDAKRAWPEQGMTKDFSARKSKISVSVCIRVGSADAIEIEAALRAAFGKAMRSTRFIVLPGVDHLVPLEDSTNLVAAIRSTRAA